ncbi:hypothetical protein KCU77_g23185, partial [Aureobasidium melanogenum]
HLIILESEPLLLARSAEVVNHDAMAENQDANCDKLILERLSHIEEMLQSAMTSAQMSVNATKAAAHVGTSPTASTSTTDDTAARRISCSVALENNRLNGLGTWDSSVNISTMPKGHTTPALNLLQWPLIRDLVSQPLDPQVLVEMEMSRPPINLPHFPRPDMVNTAVYASSYFDLLALFKEQTAVW